MSEPKQLRRNEFVKPSSNKSKETKAYKTSRFNVQTRDKHGDLLLYNTATRKLAKFAQSSSGAVLDFLRHPGVDKAQSLPFVEALIEENLWCRRMSTNFGPKRWTIRRS